MPEPITLLDGYQKPVAAVVLVDPVTLQPYAAGSSPGSPGASDASAANQLTEINRLEQVRDRLLAGGPQTGAGPVTSTTQRVTLASDGPANINLEAIRYAAEEAVAAITVPQTTLAMVAVNDAITVDVDAGVDLSIATAVPNFVAGGAFTVQFEQWNGSTWSAMLVSPKTLLASSAPVTSASQVGMYRVRVPVGISRIRVRLSAVTTLTAVWAWIERFTDGAKVHIPFAGLVSGTYGQATNNPAIPPIQWDRLGDVEVDVQAFSGTSQTLSWQATNDDAGLNWSAVAHTLVTTATPTVGTTTTSAGVYKLSPGRQYFRANLTYTALTAMTFNGIVATVVASPPPAQIVTVNGPATAGATTGLGPPVLIASQTLNAALTTPDSNSSLRPPILDTNRRLTVNARGSIPEAFVNVLASGLSATANASLLAAGGAGVRRAVQTGTVSNTSATGGVFFLVDGATDIAQIVLPPGPHLPVVLPQWNGSKRTSPNAALQYRNSAAGMAVTIDLAVFNEA